MPADWFRAEANYSHQYLEDKETHQQIESAPQHKLNARLGFKFGNGLSANLQLHWVSATVWSWTTETGAPATGPLDSYALLNGTIAYRFLADRLEIGLSAFNILDDKHQEHPLTEEIRRKVATELRLTF